MKKQPFIIGAIAVVLIGAIGAFAFFRMNGNKQTAEETDTTQKRKITLPVNQIPVEERPYVYLTPESNGRNISLTVAEVKKSADEVEYELEYQAGSLLQGAFGLVALDSLPANESILLGSCSAGGACTYHEDVKGGSLVLKFAGSEEYAVKQDWKYLDLSEEDEIVTSKDAKFQISTANMNSRYAIIYNAPGYPDGVEGTVVSEVYSLQTANSETSTAELSIRANEAGTLTIMGYDGSAWTSFETTSDDKLATAEVDLMEAYVVTAQ